MLWPQYMVWRMGCWGRGIKLSEGDTPGMHIIPEELGANRLAPAPRNTLNCKCLQRPGHHRRAIRKNRPHLRIPTLIAAARGS